MPARLLFPLMMMAFFPSMGAAQGLGGYGGTSGSMNPGMSSGGALVLPYGGMYAGFMPNRVVGGVRPAFSSSATAGLNPMRVGSTTTMRGPAMRALAPLIPASFGPSLGGGAPTMAPSRPMSVMPPNFGPSYTAQFEAMYAEVAKAVGGGLVPFFLDRIGTDLSKFQADKIHPTAAAQPELLDTVWPALAKLLR